MTLPDFSHPPVGLPAPVHPGHHPPVPTVRVPDGSPRLGITPRRGQTVAWRHEFRHGSFCDVQKFLQVYILEIYHTWIGWFPTRNFIEFENIGKTLPSWRWDDLFQELCKELGDSVTWVTSWHWCLLIFHTARSIVPCRDPLRRQFQNAELFWDVHTIHGRFTNMER